MTQKKTNSSPMAAGIAVAGLAAAAIAGGYFFYGKDGAKHRKNIKAWSIKAKGDVIEQLEKAKEISESTFLSAIETVTSKYGKMKNISPEEIEMFTKDLKRHWKDVKREISPLAKKAVKKSSSVKKAVKKVSKK